MEKQIEIPKAKLLIVNGSPREGGNSDAVVHILSCVFSSRGISYESVFLRDYSISGCVGCERCREKGECVGIEDDMRRLYPKILEARGLLLVSPAHNYNVTSWMKAFIDRFYCYYIFDNNRPRGWSSRLLGQNRIAGVIGICEQEKVEDMGFTIDAMRLPIAALGYRVLRTLPILGVFNRGKVGEEASLKEKVLYFGTELVSVFV